MDIQKLLEKFEDNEKQATYPVKSINTRQGKGWIRTQLEGAWTQAKVDNLAYNALFTFTLWCCNS